MSSFVEYAGYMQRYFSVLVIGWVVPIAGLVLVNGLDSERPIEIFPIERLVSSLDVLGVFIFAGLMIAITLVYIFAANNPIYKKDVRLNFKLYLKAFYLNAIIGFIALLWIVSK